MSNVKIHVHRSHYYHSSYGCPHIYFKYKNIYCIVADGCLTHQQGYPNLSSLRLSQSTTYYGGRGGHFFKSEVHVWKSTNSKRTCNTNDCVASCQGCSSPIPTPLSTPESYITINFYPPPLSSSFCKVTQYRTKRTTYSHLLIDNSFCALRVRRKWKKLFHILCFPL
jgi:hypothetical protein